MATEEHSTPHEGQEEYQEDRIVDEKNYQQDRTIDEKNRVARAEELEKLANQKHKDHRRIALWQLAAYVLIFSVSMAGWWKIEQEAHARCDAGEVNRQALRNLIVGVDNLGTQLVTNGKNPTTPEQDAALLRFKEFREEQLALIAGPVCRGH